MVAAGVQEEKVMASLLGDTDAAQDFLLALPQARDPGQTCRWIAGGRIADSGQHSARSSSDDAQMTSLKFAGPAVYDAPGLTYSRMECRKRR